ncbi:MAG: NAD(P)H-dependent oxidoreductase subunit E, partial [Thermoguttaceae bacterium]|nr:NAD(P)H-dependent oxidoreductase subunit E [Thermoguttaceae bacterium]
MPPIDLSFVDRTVEQLGRGPEAVIPILQALQRHYRYLPRPALERVCELTEITPATITGVSTFYTQFRHQPVGEHLISVCHGTACHVKGSQLVHDALARRLGLVDGQDTDAQGRFT